MAWSKMYMQGLYIITMLYTACFQATYVPHGLTQFEDK